MRPLVLAALVIAPAAWADGQAMLEKAEQQARGLEFPAALKSIDQALATGDNSRATLLKLYQLQGVCLATVNQEAKALKAFQVLLSLAPEARLEGNFPPRVSTAFFEARGWVGQNGSLSAEPLEAQLEDGQVKALKVRVQNDPLKLTREVRFHLIIDGKARTIDAAPQQGVAQVAVNVEKVAWWAELLGEKKSVLMPVIAEVSPRNESAAAAVAATPAPSPRTEPVPPPPPTPAVESAPPASGSGARVAGLVLAGLGLAAAGVGIGLGASSAADIARFESLERDASGKVVGMTQREAQALDAEQRTKAAMGNALLVGGGVLAAAGVVIFAASFAGGSTVAVAPAGGGVAISGTFP